MSFGRAVRIAVLLLILGVVALNAWLTRMRTTSWTYPLRVTLYPIVADGRDATRAYVDALARADFSALERFFADEARRHGVRLESPLRVERGRTLTESPPLPAPGAGTPGVVAWSLRLRWWAYRVHSRQPGPRGDVRLFVLYYDPAHQARVAHSLGLKEGLIGVVHAFASRHMAPTNNVVIAHELLHTLGATDKYDPGTGYPRFPEGFAEPGREPRFPQPAAELMGGRIPLAPGRAEIPEHLGRVVVGERTAQEIGWRAAAAR